MAMNAIIDTPSPNFDDRSLPVTLLVLHYTGMQDAAAAIHRLADPAAKVSCHYLVAEDGQIVRMVAEESRAWHAGRSHWRGIDDINSASIGIELVNPGHDLGYRPFPEAQMSALIPLMSDIVDRHGITRGNIVGHSDVAPARKIDPGELFDWERLARLRLALPRPRKHLSDPGWGEGGFLLALGRRRCARSSAVFVPRRSTGWPMASAAPSCSRFSPVATREQSGVRSAMRSRGGVEPRRADW
jgi:N-acetylmuramoyl-L-alanine amidase